jgi:hypothetical protein
MNEEKPTFLSANEIAALTGIKGGRGGRPKHALQIDQLRKMGLPFWVNAAGKPVVARAAIEGRPAVSKPLEPWQPAVISKPAA